MNAKAGLHVLSLAVAVVVASAATLANDAMEQAATDGSRSQQTNAAASSTKSDLLRSEVSVVTTSQLPRPTAASSRRVLPIIVGTYR
jgi:hypothetical protein